MTIQKILGMHLKNKKFKQKTKLFLYDITGVYLFCFFFFAPAICSLCYFYDRAFNLKAIFSMVIFKTFDGDFFPD